MRLPRQDCSNQIKNFLLGLAAFNRLALDQSAPRRSFKRPAYDQSQPGGSRQQAKTAGAPFPGEPLNGGHEAPVACDATCHPDGRIPDFGAADVRSGWRNPLNAPERVALGGRVPTVLLSRHSSRRPEQIGTRSDHRGRHSCEMNFLACRLWICSGRNRMKDILPPGSASVKDSAVTPGAVLKLDEMALSAGNMLFVH